MKVPSFLKQQGVSLVYNGEGEFLFYVPESYFAGVKENPVAQLVGYYVSLMGVCDWAIMDNHGKVSEPHPFKYPTIFLCKPYTVESVKGVKLKPNLSARDYKILHFKKGDEVVSDINTPKIIDNVETLFRLMVITGNKFPSTVRYDKFHLYFQDTMKLNGGGFDLNMQMFGLLVSEICRDSKDLSKPFRHTDMNDMSAYQQISVKQVPKYTSPYVSLTSENWDESLMAALTMDEKDFKHSPMEKILMA